MTTARSELEGQIAAKGLALGTARVVYSTKIDVETEPLLASAKAAFDSGVVATAGIGLALMLVAALVARVTLKDA